MLAKKSLGAAPAAEAIYVEDVYSTYLHTGNGSTQTITNGVDLSGEGGLVWIKSRSNAQDHQLFDTARGATKELISNSTAAEATDADTLTAFNADGFSLGADANVNTNAYTYASFTFRKQPKFFDVVTWSGNSFAGARSISHSLGSKPAVIIVKNLTNATNWAYFQDVGGTIVPLRLNTTDATSSSLLNGGYADVAAASSTAFDVHPYFGTSLVNETGSNYVAYLFASNAGGFGASGSDNVISCGSVVGSSNVEVDLGWEPQWLLVKNTSASQDWWIVDNMRGLPVQDTSSAYNASALRPNLSDAETTGFSIAPSATGFKANVLTSSQTYIYIAIRRGPMKTPTSGTSVFIPQARAGDFTQTSLTAAGFPPDTFIYNARNSTLGKFFSDRLRGVDDGGGCRLNATADSAEAISYTDVLKSFNQTGVTIGADGSGFGGINDANYNYIYYYLRRAPGFFDVVCYTGDAVNGRTVSHNLGVAPELMIIKRRSGVRGWVVASDKTYYGGSLVGYSNSAYLNTDAAFLYSSITNSTNPTSSVFTIGSDTDVNGSGSTYVAYLFASLTGVSKVFSYTGNGSSQTINCGFTAGARFILIKRTDSTGDWYVYDSARGIVSGNDPQLKLNSTAAEATGYDAIDPDNSGFIVNNDATNFPINVNNATYIGLAIA